MTSRLKTRKLAALVAVLLTPASVTAQRALGSGGAIVHEQWTVERGLPVNAVTQVVQGNDGYLWLATFDGLVRFDGVRFTVFSVENSPGLPSSRIVFLRLSADGSLWLFTEQQQVVRYRHGQFTHITALDGRAEARRQLFAESRDGRIWIASMGRLHIGRDTAFVPVPLGVGRDGRERAVTSMLVRRDGSLLVATETAELLIVRDGGTSVTPVYERMLPATANVTDMFEEPDGALWLATDSLCTAARGHSPPLQIPGRTSPCATCSLSPTVLRGCRG